ncbi:YjcZ family sporulation protein [Rummeliibacillus sp. JY-2-4R]
MSSTLFKNSYCGYERGDNNNEFTLIVVLFILKIIFVSFIEKEYY